MFKWLAGLFGPTREGRTSPANRATEPRPRPGEAPPPSPGPGGRLPFEALGERVTPGGGWWSG